MESKWAVEDKAEQPLDLSLKKRPNDDRVGLPVKKAKGKQRLLPGEKAGRQKKQQARSAVPVQGRKARRQRKRRRARVAVPGQGKKLAGKHARVETGTQCTNKSKWRRIRRAVLKLARERERVEEVPVAEARAAPGQGSWKTKSRRAERKFGKERKKMEGQTSTDENHAGTSNPGIGAKEEVFQDNWCIMSPDFF